jgi:hypothetical protein
MVIDVLRAVGAPLLAAIVGGLVVHLAARRHDVENERRRQRVDYLVGAYRTLTRAADRTLSGERAEAFEVTCGPHRDPIGFANLLVSMQDGSIVLDPHVTGACVIALDEEGAETLHNILAEWLG